MEAAEVFEVEVVGCGGQVEDNVQKAQMEQSLMALVEQVEGAEVGVPLPQLHDVLVHHAPSRNLDKNEGLAAARSSAKTAEQGVEKEEV